MQLLLASDVPGLSILPGPWQLPLGVVSLIRVFNLTAKAVNDKSCSLPVEEAGILWDSICFFFLLLQRRVFLSFYFLHVVAELQASAKQASR